MTERDYVFEEARTAILRLRTGEPAGSRVHLGNLLAAVLARAEAADKALALWEQVTPAIRELGGFADDWPDHGNAPLAVTASYALLIKRAEAADKALREIAEFTSPLHEAGAIARAALEAKP